MAATVCMRGTTVNAADEHQLTDDSALAAGQNVETTVIYSAGNTILIRIPKTISIGEDKTATYFVTVSGDIASSKKITCVPVADDGATTQTFVLKDDDAHKNDVTATITNGDMSWNYSDVSASTSRTANISADGLSAGNWTGTIKFLVKMEDA